MYIFGCTRPLFDWNYLLVEKGCREDFAVKFSVENCFMVPYLMAHHEYYLVQRRKNAVVLAAEVVHSLLWVERHSGTVTGLPPKERLQKRMLPSRYSELPAYQDMKIWTDYLPLL